MIVEPSLDPPDLSDPAELCDDCEEVECECAVGHCARCDAPLWTDGPLASDICDDCEAAPNLECSTCGGSGGGPDAALRCPGCMGSGYANR